MKKKLVSIFVLVLVVAMTLCACGGGGNSLTLATGGTSGTYYSFGGVVSQVLNENSDTTNITVTSTGASKANVQLVDGGDADLAIIQNDVMYYAYTATDMFAGEEPVTSFSAVASCYPEVIQIVSSSEITSIEDLKGKDVSVGDAGSGTEFNAKQILDAYGISFDDINVFNLSFADSADALKDGKIDAAFIVAGTPTAAVTDLATTYDLNLLAVDDAHAQQLIDTYGFYTQVVIPAGTYSGVDTDVKSVAVMATIIASNDLDQETVYQFTKGLFEYQADIALGHAKGAELNLETAVSGISVPFHAGAQQYYEEVGAL